MGRSCRRCSAGGVLAALARRDRRLPACCGCAGHYLAVATLGLIFIVQSFAVNTATAHPRRARPQRPAAPTTISGGSILDRARDVYVAWRIKHSSLGRAMLAIRENELAAACLGVDVCAATRLLAFVLGAFFAGIAGGLMGHLVTLISPSSYAFLLAFHLVVMVVLGGTGSITGAALVAAVADRRRRALRPVEEAAGLFGASQIIVALGVILVLRLRPQGLFGTAEPDLCPGCDAVSRSGRYPQCRVRTG